MDDGHEPDRSNGGSAPLEGYDRLKPRELNKLLHSHTQEELKAIETYERAHKNRSVVLDKLRYMRGRQPVPGYDQLTPAEVGEALGDADSETLKRVRDYERKFGNRPDILEEVARVRGLQAGSGLRAADVRAEAQQSAPEQQAP